MKITSGRLVEKGLNINYDKKPKKLHKNNNELINKGEF